MSSVIMSNPRIAKKVVSQQVTSAINRSGDWGNNPTGVRSVTTLQDVEVEGLVMDDPLGSDYVIISAEYYTSWRIDAKMPPAEIIKKRIAELDLTIDDRVKFDAVYAEFSSVLDAKIEAERAERQRQRRERKLRRGN